MQRWHCGIIQYAFQLVHMLKASAVSACLACKTERRPSVSLTKWTWAHCGQVAWSGWSSQCGVHRRVILAQAVEGRPDNTTRPSTHQPTAGIDSARKAHPQTNFDMLSVVQTCKQWWHHFQSLLPTLSIMPMDPHARHTYP